MIQMKDSRIKWLGEIPDKWNLKRFKYFINKSNAGEVIDKEWWNVGDQILYTCSKEPLNSNFDNFPKWKRTKKGELLLTRNGTPYIFLPENDCIYSNVVQRIILEKDSNISFVKYYLLCASDNMIGNGFTIPSFNMEIWGSICVAFPSFKEQQLIVDFLDNKVKKIEDILTDLNNQIKILKNYKKSLITEIVINGLNSNVEMKDSGIKWIGDIPKDWELTKIKYHSLRVGDGLHGTPDYDENGEYLFINGGNFKDEYITVIGNEGSINEQEFKKWYSCLLNENSVLIALNGVNYGEISYYHGEKILLGKSAGYITLDKEYNRKYVGYYLKSSSARTIMDLSLNNTTIPNLSLTTLSNFEIPLLSKKEQQEIVDFLDKKCSQIDELILDKQKQIEKMEQYKKSLVYEYVTGKKRVKGAEELYG